MWIRRFDCCFLRARVLMYFMTYFPECHANTKKPHWCVLTEKQSTLNIFYIYSERAHVRMFAWFVHSSVCFALFFAFVLLRYRSPATMYILYICIRIYMGNMHACKRISVCVCIFCFASRSLTFSLISQLCSADCVIAAAAAVAVVDIKSFFLLLFMWFSSIHVSFISIYSRARHLSVWVFVWLFLKCDWLWVNE